MVHSLFQGRTHETNPPLRRGTGIPVEDGEWQSPEALIDNVAVLLEQDGISSLECPEPRLFGGEPDHRITLTDAGWAKTLMPLTKHFPRHPPLQLAFGWLCWRSCLNFQSAALANTRLLH